MRLRRLPQASIDRESQGNFAPRDARQVKLYLHLFQPVADVRVYTGSTPSHVFFLLLYNIPPNSTMSARHRSSTCQTSSRIELRWAVTGCTANCHQAALRINKVYAALSYLRLAQLSTLPALYQTSAFLLYTPHSSADDFLLSPFR